MILHSPNVSEMGLIWSSFANAGDWKTEILIGDLRNLPVSIDRISKKLYILNSCYERASLSLIMKFWPFSLKG